jgi:hypothetical protein
LGTAKTGRHAVRTTITRHKVNKKTGFIFNSFLYYVNDVMLDLFQASSAITFIMGLKMEIEEEHSVGIQKYQYKCRCGLPKHKKYH